MRSKHNQFCRAITHPICLSLHIFKMATPMLGHHSWPLTFPPSVSLRTRNGEATQEQCRRRWQQQQCSQNDRWWCQCTLLDFLEQYRLGFRLAGSLSRWFICGSWAPAQVGCKGVPYLRAGGRMRTGGGAGVEEEWRDDSGASHRYSAIGDQALCVMFYFSGLEWMLVHVPII
jgi:hypothetical protein